MEAEKEFYDTWQSPPKAALTAFQFIWTGLFWIKKPSRMAISKEIRMLSGLKALKDHQAPFW